MIYGDISFGKTTRKKTKNKMLLSNWPFFVVTFISLDRKQKFFMGGLKVTTCKVSDYSLRQRESRHAVSPTLIMDGTVATLTRGI